MNWLKLLTHILLLTAAMLPAQSFALSCKAMLLPLVPNFEYSSKLDFELSKQIDSMFAGLSDQEITWALGTLTNGKFHSPRGAIVDGFQRGNGKKGIISLLISSKGMPLSRIILPHELRHLLDKNNGKDKNLNVYEREKRAEAETYDLVVRTYTKEDLPDLERVYVDQFIEDHKSSWLSAGIGSPKGNLLLMETEIWDLYKKDPTNNALLTALQYRANVAFYRRVVQIIDSSSREQYLNSFAHQYEDTFKSDTRRELFWKYWQFIVPPTLGIGTYLLTHYFLTH